MFRIHNMFKMKNRTYLYPGLLFIVFVAMFFYINLDIDYKQVKDSSEKCLIELSNAKYQLDVVTEHKSRMERQVFESHRNLEAEKLKTKELIDDYGVIKQQTSICQAQFEDLQIECKKIREENDELRRKLPQIPTT